MAKKLTPKTRAVRMLESLEWIVGDVEKFIPRTNVRQDLWGLFDLIAIKGRTTLGLQVTVPDRVADHVYKMMAEPQLRVVLGARWLAEVWGVRNEDTKDGSFAVTRSFELDQGGSVLLYEGSDVLD